VLTFRFVSCCQIANALIETGLYPQIVLSGATGITWTRNGLLEQFESLRRHLSALSTSRPRDEKRVFYEQVRDVKYLVFVFLH
jgi:hypothetical protein